MKIEELINNLRKEIKETAAKVNIAVVKDDTWRGEKKGEAIANLMLSYRHLEDASMRLGKVLQAINGGVSIYDHNVVGDPTENN